ncbi:MRG-domain-containing protein [Gaertneriomyces semiglobifer]|nr:MRG-domain-containing protein [Gaertneriomyces semiglobifer]
MALTFDNGEQVLCFHGPLLYEAKVLKAELWQDKAGFEDGSYYFVHYKGWKNTWDEWVPESRILKFTPENLQKQADLKDAVMVQKKAAQLKKSAAAAASGEGDTRKRKTREESAGAGLGVREREEEFLKRPEVKISIPESLKTRLVEEWEWVTKEHKLVPLPRTPTVQDILQSYSLVAPTYFSKHNATHLASTLAETLEGLRLYFDKALGNLLLYRFERQQYVDIRKRLVDKEVSAVYGAEHLLRMFVQLPSLIAHTNMEREAVSLLKDHFALVLEWMEENLESLFVKEGEYGGVPSEYLSGLRG